MTVKTGMDWAGTFVTLDSTGALSTPSTGPAGVLYVDGVANGATVTISGSNPYKWSVALPSLTAGQRVDMYITATIATIATAGFVASEQADTVQLNDLAAALQTVDDNVDAILVDTGTDIPAALTTIQADLDNPSQYMADVSGLATAADLATVDGVVDAIKAKTDLLPADPAGVSDIPTSGDIADAVWDELLSGHVVAGSAGEALAASGSASDPLLNQVPGSYASGTAGAALGRIGSGQITTVSPVAQDGDVTTIRGDDYDNAHGRALDWTDSEAAWPDLTGATIEVIIGGIVELAGSVVTPSGSGKKVRLELTDVQTAAIRSGVHAFQVIATLADADIVTLVEGNWTSKRRLAA